MKHKSFNRKNIFNFKWCFMRRANTFDRQPSRWYSCKNNNNNGYFLVLFLQRAHSLFIFIKNGVTIELGKNNRSKELRMMQNRTSNKQTMCQLTKTKNENKKHLLKKKKIKHYVMQQTTLSKLAIYIALK